MLFLLNSPERFTFTVKQSKAKSNKQDNPSYCRVHGLFMYRTRSPSFDGLLTELNTYLGRRPK